MYIELKSSDKENHKAFEKYKDFSKGGFIILNEKANSLNLNDLKAYICLQSDLEDANSNYIFSITNKNSLDYKIGYKRDKVASNQKYKKKYTPDCWCFNIQEDISEENLLFLASLIFTRFHEACVIYCCKTKNIYELTKRNKFNGITLSKEFIEKYKSFQTNFLMRILKNLINDRSYKIYKFHKNDKVLAENFINGYENIVIKIIADNQYFISIPMNNEFLVYKNNDYKYTEFECKNLNCIKAILEEANFNKIIKIDYVKSFTNSVKINYKNIFEK